MFLLLFFEVVIIPTLEYNFYKYDTSSWPCLSLSMHHNFLFPFNGLSPPEPYIAFLLFSSRKIQLFQNPYAARNIFKVKWFCRYFNFKWFYDIWFYGFIIDNIKLFLHCLMFWIISTASQISLIFKVECACVFIE